MNRNSKRNLPYRFLGRGFLILSPVILFMFLAESFMWLSGETVPVRWVARHYLPGGPPSAYLPALMGQQFNLLHYERVKKLRPRLLTLGSSRVTRFRAEMFGPDAGFYNSGRTISCVGDLEEYFAALPPDYHPDVLLLGIDSWWFKGNLPTVPRFAADIQQDDVYRVNAHIYSYRKIYHAARKGSLDWGLFWKIMTRQDEGVKRFGLIAWRSSGMRNDGSNQMFDRSTPNTYHDELPESVEEIMKMKHPLLIPCPRADEDLLRRFEAVLQRTAAAGTKIVAFIPPLASEVRVAYAEKPIHYGFYEDFRTRISAMFQRNHWHFFDAHDPKKFGLDDRSMKDKDHAQETFHVALLLLMARNPEVREALRIDPDYLQSLLIDPETTPWYPDYSLNRE